MEQQLFNNGLTQPLFNKMSGGDQEAIIGLMVNLRMFLDSAILSQYCFCDLQQEKDKTVDAQSVEQSSTIASPMRKRKALEKFNFAQKVSEFYNVISAFPDNHDEVVIHAKKKAAPRNLNSFRRSKYIGVFRNGANWQALICINKAKTYIGTYSSEHEAAQAFDFHSIALNGLMAGTNFDYTKAQIMEMIMAYESNEGKFIPSSLN